jgi:hypothetical protein
MTDQDRQQPTSNPPARSLAGTPGRITDPVDPRSVSDRRILDEHSQAEVEAWRRDAHEKHRRWMDVMHNPYGKD